MTTGTFLAGTLKKLELGRTLRDCKQALLFGREAQQSLCRGVFKTFSDAVASAPKNGKKIGFDHPEAASFLDHWAEAIFPYDYPILFWLKPQLTGPVSIFDFGGNTGVKYRAYRKYLTYGGDLKWLVCDLPEVIKAGQKISQSKESPGLSFTTHFAEAEGTDVMLASGVVQYIETPFSQMLASLKKKPAHLLMNKVPLYEGGSFVTLQAMGVTYAPYHIFNRDKFVTSICEQGYELVDTWLTNIGCSIPFHPEKSVPACVGLYFRLAK